MGRRQGSPLKNIYRSIEYYIFYFLLEILSLFPLRFNAKVGELIGKVIYMIDRRHRTIAINNFRLTLGKGKDICQARMIVKRSLENLGRSGGEFISIKKYTKENIKEFVVVEGWENFKSAHEEGKGVIFLTGHFGNWELLALAMSFLGYPTYVVVRPLDNRLLDKRVNEMRGIGGNRVIYKKNALSESLKLLKRGEMVGFLLDQNVSRNEGVFVDFLGREACTNRGMALIALKSRALVIPAFIVREGPVSHRIIFEKGVEIIRSGDISEDIIRNTQRFTKIIESYIIRYPDQWLWVHDRWKTRPLSEQTHGLCRGCLPSEQGER